MTSAHERAMDEYHRRKDAIDAARLENPAADMRELEKTVDDAERRQKAIDAGRLDQAIDDARQQIRVIESACVAIKHKRLPSNLTPKEIKSIKQCNDIYLGDLSTRLIFDLGSKQSALGLSHPDKIERVEKIVERLDRYADQVTQAQRIIAVAEINQFIEKLSDPSRYKANPLAKQALLTQFQAFRTGNLPIVDLAESIPSWKALLKQPRYVPGKKLSDTWVKMLGPNAESSQNPVSLLLAHKSSNPNAISNRMWSFAKNVFNLKNSADVPVPSVNNLKQTSKAATVDYRQSIKSVREKNQQEQSISEKNSDTPRGPSAK